MSEPTALEARTIVVERLEVSKSGFRNNRPWTLYEVHATDARTGERLTGLRTFRPLPAGPVEVALEPYNGSGTWTVTPTGKLPNASTARTTAHVDADGDKHYGVAARVIAEQEGDRVTRHANQRERIEALEARATTLEAEVADLRARLALLARLLDAPEPAA